jgi:hypothetical protein
MDDLDLTPRQKLQLAACRAVMKGDGPPHPALGLIPFGEMTEAQLRELIAWHDQAASSYSSS